MEKDSKAYVRLFGREYHDQLVMSAMGTGAEVKVCVPVSSGQRVGLPLDHGNHVNRGKGSGCSREEGLWRTVA